MKSFLRVGLPIAIILGMVGGVTYLTQYTPPAQPKTPSKASPSADGLRKFEGPSLLISERVALWDANDPSYQQEFEVNTKGHYDFFVANPHLVPARLFLKAKSCTCASVQVGLINSDAVLNAIPDMSAPEAARKRLNRRGLGLPPAQVSALVEHVAWQPLNVAEATREIPPADERLGMRLAVVRMIWDAKNFGPQRLTADVNYVGGDPKPAEVRFEVPLVVVPAVQFFPMQTDVGAISSGNVRKIIYILWSATHDAFPLVLPNTADEPCLVFTPPQTLTAEECQKYSQELPRIPNQLPTRVRAGYRTTLTIHERLGENQLDLGPFTRRFAFNPGTQYEAVVTVNGSVVGDVRLDGGDVIKLGMFPADLPKTKDVLLTTTDLGTALQVVSTTPDELQVTLKKKADSVATWELRIVVPANSVSGPLAANSAVVLQTAGPGGRRIRIPITGSALVR